MEFSLVETILHLQMKKKENNLYPVMMGKSVYLFHSLSVKVISFLFAGR